MIITEISEDLIRVVILDVSGLYAQIYDELYCSKEKYNDVLQSMVNLISIKL